jgi:putative ABC transport system permease protein
VTTVLRLTIRTLRAHGLRLLLSALAIVFGVAFIAGTFIFSDGLKKAAYEKAGRLDRNTDVEVLPRTTDRTTAPVFDAATVDKVRRVDGVQAAEGLVGHFGIGLVGRDGRPIPGYHYYGTIPLDPALRSFDLKAGRLPARTGELVLDARTVDKRGFKVGDEVRAGSSKAPARPYVLVGVVDTAGSTVDFGGAFVGLVLDDAVALREPGSLSRVVVAARPGVSERDLAGRIQAEFGTKATVRTHQQLLDAALSEAVGNGDNFKQGVLTFALISIFVAAFVIANTFTIVLAQRTREIALLRLVGTTRAQAFGSVVAESAIVGLVASALGVVTGVGIAAVLREVFAEVGSGMPSGLLVTGRTVAIGLLSGTTVTVLAALLPAWRGTRVPPVAALSDAAVETTRRAGRVRLAFGALCLAGGVAAVLAAAPLKSPLVLGAGGVLGFLGIAMFGPALVPALVRVVGWPLARFGGATPALAVANAVRNPRRIAATATALVIGLSLVSAFVVGAQSAKDGVERAVDARIGANFVLESSDGLPQPLVQALRTQRELGIVHLEYNWVDEGTYVESAHPTLLARTQRKVRAGNVAALAPGTAVVTDAVGKGLGEKVTVRGKAFTVVAVLPARKPEAGSVDRTVYLTEADGVALFPEDKNGAYSAQIEPAAGVGTATAAAILERLAVDYPTVIFQDRAAYKKAQTSTIDLVLGFVTALLGLAVIIALIGVANTLTLSVVERTREHGILRAIGLTRGRLRGMLATEAVLIAIVGALLGVGLGTAVSAGAVRMLSADGEDFSLVMPWNRLAIVVAVIAFAALAASILPAYRATRGAVVAAVATE